MKDWKEFNDAESEKQSVKRNDIINKLHSLSPGKFNAQIMDELLNAVSDIYKKHDIHVIDEEFICEFDVLRDGVKLPHDGSLSKEGLYELEKIFRKMKVVYTTSKSKYGKYYWVHVYRKDYDEHADDILNAMKKYKKE